MIFLINWLISSFLHGFIFFALFLFALYWFYLKELTPSVAPPVKPQFEDYTFSPIMKEMLDKTGKTSDENNNRNASNMLALNMLFQFLFQELKDTKAVRRYIIRKMTFEFKELMNNKTASKLITRIAPRDFSLGTGFPIFHSLKLISHQMDKDEKTIQDLCILVDIEYKDGFSISVDADLILGRSAYVHIKIVSLVGRARIQFTRHPFTHWNFAFVDDPQIDFAASSQFDGRQIPQLTNLLVNQLRRSVRRKHTLPNYKCRFKPFFDVIYNQSLYKKHIDEMLAAEKTTNELSHEDDGVDNDELESKNTLLSKDEKSKGSLKSLDDDVKVNGAIKSITKSSSSINLDRLVFGANGKNKSLDYDKKSIVNNARYRRLCDKFGFDLTSIGNLNIKFKSCDRLPESLYSINLPQFQYASQQYNNAASQDLQAASQTSQLMPRSISSQYISPGQQLQQQQQQENNCFIYLTTSMDNVSMSSLMEKQISKQDFPTFEFELSRFNLSNQSLGLSYMEVFFMNRTEVAIQKIAPNSLASTIKDLKIFDIVYSINGVLITSLKNLNKTIQKSGTSASLKFVVKRPCILLSKPIHTSSSLLNAPSTSQTNNTLSTTPAKKSNSDGETNSTDTSDSSNAPALPTQQTNSSLSIVLNTRSKLEKLEQKLKSSFGSTLANNINSQIEGVTNDTTSSTNNSNTISAIPVSSVSSTPNTIGNVITSAVPLVTHTASASCLVDYFCSLAEATTIEDLPQLDLISLLTNSATLNGNVEAKAFKKTPNDTEQSNENETMNGENGELAEQMAQKQRAQAYFKGTRVLKLEKENLFSSKNCPVQIDESFAFDLTKNTKYLNVFLWTVQYVNKMAKIRNLFVGYISLPLHECVIDCWNVSKGETQTTINFQPINELRTSVISRVIKSHVISDHPGFDPNIAVGTLTLQINHKLPISEPTIGEEPSVKQNIVDILQTKIADELIEQNDLESEMNKKINDLNMMSGYGANGGGMTRGMDVDDGSLHKFYNIQFNDSVLCKFCNKKIWFKNAYKCVYCNMIIHIKCYDKTMGKTICERFFNKNNMTTSSATSKAKSTDELNKDPDDAFVMISDDTSSLSSVTQRFGLDTSSSSKGFKRSSSPSQHSLSPSENSANGSSGTRGLVSNIINGIRQRKKTDNVPLLNRNSVGSTNSSSSISGSVGSGFSNAIRSGNFLTNFNLVLPTKIKGLNSNINKEAKIASEDNVKSDYLMQEKTNDDNLSIEVDDFKDMDQNEDKLYGTDLFDELPVNERKLKFEETIQKYQSTIEMMSKLKSDLEKELAGIVDAKSLKYTSIDELNANPKLKSKLMSLNQQEAQIKTQIKHLEEQMKGVVFLLMQCQIGFESFNDQQKQSSTTTANIQNDDINENFIPLPTPPPIPITKEAVLNENNSLHDNNNEPKALVDIVESVDANI